MELFITRTLKYLFEKYPKGVANTKTDYSTEYWTPWRPPRKYLTFSDELLSIDLFKDNDIKVTFKFYDKSDKNCVEYYLNTQNGEYSSFVRSSTNFKKLKKIETKSKWVIEDIRFFGNNSLDFIMGI